MTKYTVVVDVGETIVDVLNAADFVNCGTPLGWLRILGYDPYDDTLCAEGIVPNADITFHHASTIFHPHDFKVAGIVFGP